MLLSLAFFLLPWTWFGGVALQAAGFYLAALLLPLIFFSHSSPALDPHSLKKWGITLFLMWGIYPFSSLIYLISQGTIGFSFRQIFASEMSSCFLFGSIILFFSSFFFRTTSLQKQMETTQNNAHADSLLRIFLLGMLSASLVWWTILFSQHLLGWDVHGPTYHLAPEHQLLNGRYRVFGWFGHPLSVSAVALHFSIWMFIFTAYTWKRWRSSALLALVISLLHLHILFMASGRSALVSGAIVAFAILFRKFKKWSVIFGTFITLILWKFSFYERYLEIVQQYHSTGFLPDRLRFWKVHFQLFLENPLFGAGYVDLQNLRELMYQRSGYLVMLDRFNAHNMYLEVLSVTGIFGLAISIYSASCLWKILKNKVTRSSSQILKYLCFSFYCAIVANLLHGFTQNVFQDSNVTYSLLGSYSVLFWLLSRSTL